MAGKLKSQWEFGDLFEKGPARQIFSVGQITGRIRQMLEKEYGNIWITGEVTNVRLQSSGHLYFTLKDSAAQLSCVLFRAEAPSFKRELLKEGSRINLRGGLSVYEARGQYQLIVAEIELQGQGALQQAFERLKLKLQLEGLFKPERKRPIPKYPQRIGIVTSPTGAALQDVLHVFRRRHPRIELILAPCRVQGDGAPDEVAFAIVDLNKFSQLAPENRLDVILVTRGGGSLEDLWAFNDETVARTIFSSQVPVISAIGHEIDFTISDFVADLRAATPSAAAELLTNGIVESRTEVIQNAGRLARVLRQRIERCGERLENLRQRLERMHPKRTLREQAQHIDDLAESIVRCMRKRFRELQLEATRLAARFERAKPSAAMQRRREKLTDIQRRITAAARTRLNDESSDLKSLAERLELLSPKAILKRGYSITLDAENGKALRSAKRAVAGKELRTILAEGEVRSRVLPSES